MSYDDWGVEDGGIKHDTDEFDKREKVENRALDKITELSRKSHPSLFLPPCSLYPDLLFS